MKFAGETVGRAKSISHTLMQVQQAFARRADPQTAVAAPEEASGRDFPGYARRGDREKSRPTEGRDDMDFAKSPGTGS